MIDENTIVVGTGPRISRDRFVSVLNKANAPIGSQAGEVWDFCVARSVDPLFVLAIGYIESHFETHPASMTVKYRLNNPGSRRSARVVPCPHILTEKGPFAKYSSSYQGWCDIAYSLTDPSFVYVREGRRDIRDIVERWAPSSENDTRAYIDTVIAFMNRMVDVPSQDDGVSAVQLDTKFLGNVLFRVSYIPNNNPNYPGYHMTPKWITVHETGNTNPGANAEMHRRFVHNGGGEGCVSFHFVVDSKEIIQLLPLNVNGWHAGDGPNGEGNRASIGIETCVNQDGKWQQTLDNLRQLLVALCRQFNLGVGQIVQHNKWSGKNCPARLRQSGWFELIKAVETELKGMTESVRYFEETNCSVGHGFLRFFDQYGGVRVFGYPLTNEIVETTPDGKTRTVQYFEKAVFEWWPENPADWQVLLRRLGADALQRKQERQRTGERLKELAKLVDEMRAVVNELKQGAGQ